MRFLIFAVLIAATLAAVFIHATEGLDCYTCYHTKAIGAPDTLPNPYGGGKALTLDGSCKDGKKPKSKFSNTCTGDSPVCYKLVTQVSDDIAAYDVTVRGCSSFLGMLVNNTCISDNFPQSSVAQVNLFRLATDNSTIGNSSVLNVHGGAGRDMETQANKEILCSCIENECNGASAMARASITAFAAAYFVIKVFA